MKMTKRSFLILWNWLKVCIKIHTFAFSFFTLQIISHTHTHHFNPNADDIPKAGFALKLDSYQEMLAFFNVKRWGELRHFHSHLTPPPCCKTLMQSVWRRPIESPVMSVKHYWNWAFLQLVQWHRSSGNVLISIYPIDAHDFKNKNTHARERRKTQAYPSMNPA